MKCMYQFYVSSSGWVSCASLVIWIQIMMQISIPSLALKGDQLPFCIHGQWKDFYCLFQRQRAFVLLACVGRCSVPAPHLSRADILGSCFMSSLCNIDLDPVPTWAVSFQLEDPSALCSGTWGYSLPIFKLTMYLRAGGWEEATFYTAFKCDRSRRVFQSVKLSENTVINDSNFVPRTLLALFEPWHL